MESNDDLEILDLSNEYVELDDESDVEENHGEEIEIVDQADAVFGGHTNAVLCCALSSDSQLAITGGQDDTAFLFTKEMQLLLQCKGHNDSVICVGFNSSNKHVATADMKGLVQVWELSTCRKQTEYDFADDLLWMCWHPILDDVLLVGTSSGSSLMWKITNNQCKVYQSGGSASVCGRFLQDGRRTVIAYDDGCIRIWDLRNQTAIAADSVHNQTITALDLKNDDSLVASASVDGTAKLVNISTAKVIASFDCLSENEALETESVEAVCFCETLPLLATGTTAGDIQIWDISTQKKRNVCPTEAGVSKLSYDKNSGHLLYASGLDGVVKIYDSRSGRLELEKTGHSEEILDFCVANDSSFLLTASEDKTCRLFSLP